MSKGNRKGEIKLTNLHHEKYDENDPLAHTVELCVECHNKKEPRPRNKIGQFIKITAIEPL